MDTWEPLLFMGYNATLVLNNKHLINFLTGLLWAESCDLNILLALQWNEMRKGTELWLSQRFFLM